MVLRIAVFVAFVAAAGVWFFYRKPPTRPIAIIRGRLDPMPAPDRDLPTLEAAAAANPRDASAIRGLAHAYALELLEPGPRAKYAQDALDASKNVWIVGNAAYMLQSQYNLTRQQGSPNAGIAAMAERYFLQAKALDPSLDREKILPRIEAVVAKPEVKLDWDAAAKKIRRLPISAFPQLPSAIAALLIGRNCTIPQPYGDGPARNVIRGEFFAKGEGGWAVLCSVNEKSSILAFRNARDSTPASLSTSEDRRQLQGLGGEEIGYSRQIMAVDRGYILAHHRSVNDPPSPPIDHQGIDDVFLGKGSVTWYFHQGKWLPLPGAD